MTVHCRGHRLGITNTERAITDMGFTEPSREHDHGPTVVYSKAEVENDEGSTQKTEILQLVLKEGERWEMIQRGSN